MMAEAAHIVPDLRPDIFIKILCQFIDSAGKHQILPDYQSQLIAGIIKIVMGIESASPYPDTVIISRPALFQQFPGPLPGDSAENIVFRYIIRAHGKNLHAVYLMGKALAVYILLPVHGHGPKPYPLLPSVNFTAAVHKLHTNSIQILFPVSVRPPQKRLCDDQTLR